MKKKEIVKNINIVLMAILFFSSTALYTEDHMTLYLGINATVLFCMGCQCIFVPRLALSVFKNEIAFWIMSFFFLYFFYGLIWLRAGNFNFDFNLFSVLSLLVTLSYFQVIEEKHDFVEIVCKAAILASLLICTYVFINEYEVLLAGSDRIGDTLSGNVNTVGMHLGFYSLLIFYWYLNFKKKKTLIVYIVIISFMLLTGSKKVLFQLLLAGILYIKMRKISIKTILKIVLLIVLFLYLIMTVPLFFNIIGFRIIDFLGTLGFNVGNFQISNSTQIREIMIQIAFSAFKLHPIFGGGVNYFEYYSGLGAYSHNNYTEILVTFGIVGFVLFYWLPIKLLFKGYKKRDYLSIILTLNFFLIGTSAVLFSSGIMCYLPIIIANFILKNEGVENG